jgi:putative YphP/YqiW family bacilliredoxin
MIQPFRDEVTRLGVRELRTPADVREAVTGRKGTALVFVNSVCGCAGGIARPGLALALKHPVQPDVTATVFAGGDVEATQEVRRLAVGQPPSSPSAVLFRDGACVWMLHRHEIEGRDAASVAAALAKAYDTHCAAAPAGRR